jgi:hypothetical protein
MSGARAVFFEEADARSVLARLRRDGHVAEVARDRFAGEDDDTDLVWVVTADAPVWAMDLLVEEHDGWLDVPDERPQDSPGERRGGPPPLDLPTAPRRATRQE